MTATDVAPPVAAPGTERLTLLVRQVRLEATGIHSYELVDPNGDSLPAASAGSHIDVHLQNGIVRQYSLAHDPAQRHHYLIAVLREDRGRGGSRSVHETLHVGDRVRASVPRNSFRLARDARRHVLIAGGIGITPLLAMHHELAAANAKYEVHYCAKSRAHAAFAGDLEAAGAKFYFDGGDPRNGLDIAGLLRECVDGTHVYFCGPPGFMAACAAATAHWPKERVHSEYFAVPIATADLPTALGAFTVEIASTGLRVTVGAEQSIVDALHENGIAVETSCVSGLCGTCKVGYLAGTVEHRDFILDDSERESFLTTCVSRASSPSLTLDL